MSRKIDVYTIKELKEKNPVAYDYAWEQFKKEISNDPYLPWQEEIMDSLKATFDNAGVSLRDWSIGAYSYSNVKFSIPTYWSELADADILVDDYEGRRAYNWLKDVFALKSYRRVAYKDENNKTKYRYDYKKLDGADWTCEFTGMWYDHVYLESLFECIHDGMTLQDAFSNLADEARKLLEDEYEYQLSEESFLEESNANNYEYTENGDKI